MKTGQIKKFFIADSSDYQILGMMKFKTNKEDIWRFGHIGHIGQS